MLKFSVFSICWLIATSSASAQPLVGAWRKVRDENMANQYRFAMLRSTVASGTDLLAVDWKAKKLICCLSIQGAEVTEEKLRGSFSIPGVWVSDLTNDWNSDQLPYKPRIFLLTPTPNLSTHQFSGNSPFVNGGLLVPRNSQMDASGQLAIGQEKFHIKFLVRPLADDDGAVHVYTLTGVLGGKPIVVEVPFGTY